MKIAVPNRAGQYELNGVKISVSENEVIIETEKEFRSRSTSEPRQNKRYVSKEQRATTAQNVDDVFPSTIEHPSLLGNLIKVGNSVFKK